MATVSIVIAAFTGLALYAAASQQAALAVPFQQVAHVGRDHRPIRPWCSPPIARRECTSGSIPQFHYTQRPLGKDLYP